MKKLRFTISGSYRGNAKKIMDFDNIVGEVPFCDEDVALMHVRSRYAPMWIAADKRYTERLTDIREVYVDDIKEVEGEVSCVGKDIRVLNYEELQDLATLKDIRGIPLYKRDSLQATRFKAYKEYVKQVHGDELDKDLTPESLRNLPPVIVEHGHKRESVRKLTNDDVIEQEATNKAPELTLDELKEIAKAQKLEFHPAIGRESLYKKLYG